MTQDFDLFELIVDLNSVDELIRKAAFTQIVDLGEDAVPELLELFPTVRGNARLQLISAFGEIGDPRAAAALREVVANQDLQEYLFASSLAAKALRAIGDPREVVQLLEDNRPGTRRMAAVVLGNIGDASAVPELVGALDDKDRKVADYAAKALEKIGSPGAMAALEAWRGE